MAANGQPGGWSDTPPPPAPPPVYPSGKGKGKVKGKKGPPSTARVTVTSLAAHEQVDVFHRYSQDPNGYFMVENACQGIIHPSVGRTDGWTTAAVSQPWDARYFDPNNYQTWVEIRWSHPLWYNRRGHRLDTSQVSMITQRVLPSQIRKKGEISEAQQQPKVSMLMVRWGGEQPVNPVTEGAGGWGNIGSTPSDNYINGFMDHVYDQMGPQYEIISTFFQSSEELLKIQPQLIRHMMRGKSLAGFYFCWPIIFQDGHNYPAYVDTSHLLQLMTLSESSGVPTRFPHQSHLYKIFASKEWTAQMCLHPLFKVPLTTMVSRQAVACAPAMAAEKAMQALHALAKTRSSFAAPLGQPPLSEGPVNKGVAKLGWSWEAMDVQKWENKEELTSSLQSLAEQPGSFMPSVFVQEWVDFDIEMRHFVVEPDINDRATWKPQQIIYTVFKSQESNSFGEFDKYDRAGAMKRTFEDDDAAMADAEQQAEELIHRWLQWLQAQTHELPTVTRFDILAKRVGPGKARVMTGELTELGGCFLGWQKGPEVVFGAMLRSCFRDGRSGPY